MKQSSETHKKNMGNRVDDFGRAYAGSQRQIQTYVNLPSLEFAEKVLAQFSPPAPSQSRIHWVSPLASDKFAEYRDDRFLRALGLEAHAHELQEFWPKGGPSWDALGTLGSPSGGGVVLVEAKSHPSELHGKCQAADPKSKGKIDKALGETKKWLGAQEGSDWRKLYYQAANRYAHLYFLRNKGIEAWLVNVYFLSDPHFKDSPRSRAEWEPIIDNMKQALGLSGRDVPHTVGLFLKASEGY